MVQNYNGQNFIAIDAPPDPNVVESLRDVGYSTETAVADIIDNSIDAQATIIRVSIFQEPDGEVELNICDNGCGMNKSTLINALTLGKTREEQGRLGKFGMGLKTASTSMGRIVSVITRDSGDNPPVKLTYDLNFIKGRNQIMNYFSDPDEYEIGLLNEVSPQGSGTVVRILDLDKFMDKFYGKPPTTPSRNHIRKELEKTTAWLSMVFKRFIDNEDDRQRNIKIFINDVEVEPHDTFCDAEPRTQLIVNQIINVETLGDQSGEITVRGVVLPREESFINKDGYAKAGVTPGNQGVFVYREGRLIQKGDWLGIFRPDTHMHLGRVELSFSAESDAAFKVDIAKSKWTLAPNLHRVVGNLLSQVRMAANKTSREGIRATYIKESKHAHSDSNKRLIKKEGETARSKLEITDHDNNSVKITNILGEFMTQMPIGSDGQDDHEMVQVVDSLIDGNLWEVATTASKDPRTLSSHHTVQLNADHPYYNRVYLPNYNRSVTMQGLDSLLWSLALFETEAWSDEAQKFMRDMKRRVSQILRDIVEDMPEND